MPDRPIRLYGDPVLSTVSDPITTVDDGVRALVADLVDSVKVEGRAGVAACQIGVGLRAFSYNVDGEIGYIINPELVEVSGEPELVDEGCLSVPGLWFKTARYPFARVRGIDLDGNEIELSGTGVMAQALQHETDHLDGRLYLDRLDKETRREAMRQLERVGLAERAFDLAGSLPLGNQRLLEIARALAADPVLLVLDEPAAGLRRLEKEALARLLRALRGEGLSILLVEHDMEFVMGLVDRSVVMDFGSKLCEGLPAEIRRDPRVQEAYLGGVV